MSNPSDHNGSARAGNQTSRYLKYAIGEILLVVIGILIALQVNNWNEKRKSKATRDDYLNQLSLDIDIMHQNYKGLVTAHQKNLELAREAYSIINSCQISSEQESNFKNLLLSYDNLGVLYQVRDTYEEMLSANLVASIEDKEFKHILSEFFAHRDAMQVFIDQFKGNLNADYKIVKDHLLYGFDSANQPTVSYELEELCQSASFKNALVEVVNTRDATYQMVSILYEKLGRMQELIKAQTTKN